jgi:hypothetical protein
VTERKAKENLASLVERGASRRDVLSAYADLLRFRLAHWRNHLLYGSHDGPAIEINWETREITFSRMSRRRSIRMLRWMKQGERDVMIRMLKGAARGG